MIGQNTPSAEAAAHVKKHGLIAIVRGDYSAQEIIEIGDALLAAPVLIAEVTLNSAGALNAIADLRERYGEHMLVGAGTVRTAAQFDEAVAAGAQFTVAPNFDEETVRRAVEQDVLHLPGIFTATEAQTAIAAGSTLLKLFPSDVVGPKYLKALRAPLSDVEFVPTGGIDVDNIGDYAQAGAVAVGIGSALIPKRDWSAQAIISKARALRSAWEQG